MKNIFKLCCIVISLILLSSCTQTKSNLPKENIDLLLDWVPNTNHTGIYVSDRKGYFAQEGIKINILQPPEDSSIVLTGAGKAQFCIGFQDYLADALANENPLPVTAVAAILQHNTSGILSKKESNILTPKDMENHIYSTYSIPIEQAIIKYAIEKEKGNYNKIIMVPNSSTDIVSALQTNIDAVNAFYGWDGIKAEILNMSTNFFYFKDIDPAFDYYTPLIIGNNEYISSHPDTTGRFLKALKRGYEFAEQNPDEAAEILLRAVPELDRNLIIASQKFLSTQYKADSKEWGIIDRDRWNKFYEFLYSQKLISKDITNIGFSNEYLLN